MPGTVLHVLIADSDPAIRFYLLKNLKAEGYAVADAACGRTVLQAFERGADDVVAKPFGIRELVARVRNALRRAAQARGETPRVTVGDLEVDLMHRRVQVRGTAVHLTPIEYEVLRHLVEGGGRVLGHRELLDAVWGAAPPGRVQYLRVVIRALRRKIEQDQDHPRHILTEPRVGYRLAAPVRWIRPGDARTCA